MTSGGKSSKVPVLEVENCIRYWERIMFHEQFLLSPSVKVTIESTITHLKNQKIYLDGIKEVQEKLL